MILTFTREQIVALALQGMVNKKSPLHWDICNELKKGKTSEQVAEDLKIKDDSLVRYVHCKKCPEV